MKSYFKVDKKDIKLIEFLSSKLPGISKGILQKQLKLKEIKVSNKRVSENITLAIGSEVEIFLPTDFSENIHVETVFEDDNILIVDKPSRIDTVEGLLPLLKKDRQELYAVHRLDRNTTGLVVFAKTKEAESQLEEVFKNRKLTKFYEARVKGAMPKKEELLVAFLRKDENKRMSLISFKEIAGYGKIETGYSVISKEGETSLLRVELFTGKMHQIRAHLASIGHPIVGDEKYGDTDFNKKLGKKIQELRSVELVLNGFSGSLGYLNGKILKTKGLSKE